jgi:hypothetical protein
LLDTVDAARSNAWLPLSPERLTDMHRTFHAQGIQQFDSGNLGISQQHILVGRYAERPPRAVEKDDIELAFQLRNGPSKACGNLLASCTASARLRVEHTARKWERAFRFSRGQLWRKSAPF